MSTPFSRSIHSLAADRFRRSLLGMLLVTALLSAWATWFFLARITLYEVSATARLEVSEAAHPVEAQVAGQVRATHLTLGREVQGGDVLVELDADAQRLRLQEERTRLTALAPEPAVLRDEISAGEAAQREDQRAGQIVRDQARARHGEAEAAAQLAGRAPVAGRLGEVATLQVGGMVHVGARLGAVVPPGALKIMTDFLPPAALGRIQPGQPARLRLEGFPWTQYGDVAATVASVASEVREGRVRVELAVRPEAAPLIPLQHGLPGTIEVEVDHVSPAQLVLRTAGLLAMPGTSCNFQGGRGADR
jgi:multidrug resistance efflux pump